MCALKRRDLQRPEEGSRFPMFGVTGNCVLRAAVGDIITQDEPGFCD